MALNMVDKTKLNGILKQYGASEMYFNLFVVNNPCNYTYSELLEFFLNLYEKKLSGKEKCSDNYLIKVLTAIYLIIEHVAIEEAKVEEYIYDRIELIKDKYLQYVKNFSIEENSDVINTLNKVKEILNTNYIYNPDCKFEEKKMKIQKMIITL